MRLEGRFLLVSAGALVIAAAGLFSLLRETGRMRGPGVTLAMEEGTVVVASVDDRRARGLLPGDRIAAIDGTPVASLGDPSRSLSQRPGPVSVVALRAEGPESIDFFPSPIHPNWRFLFLALVGTATLAVALGAIRRAPKEPGATLFAAASLALAAILVTTPVRYDAIGRLLFGFEEVARALVPPLLLHFAIRAPAGRPRFAAAPLLYLPALLLLGAEADLYLAGGAHLPISAAAAVPLFDRLFALHLGLAGGLSVLSWSLRLLHQPTGETARRMRWLLAGVAGGLLPVAALSAFPRIFGAEFEFVGTLALPTLALVPAGAAAALVRFRLQEVDRVVAHAAGTAVSGLAALVVLGSANLAFSELLPDLGEAPRHLVSLSAAFGALAVLAPTRRRVSDWALRLQQRVGERERRALVDFAREVAIHDDPIAIGRALLERIEGAIPVASANLWVALGGDRLVRVRPDGESPDEVTPADAPTRLAGSAGGARAAFPMVSRGRLVGWLLVEGADGLPPDSADRSLLEALAASAAVGLDNARLYRDLAREHERVRQLADFNERVLESAGSALAVVDAGGFVRAANTRLAGWLGLTREAMLGQSLATIFPPAAAARVGAGETSVRWIPAGEERERVLELRREPLTGVPGATVVAASDVTEADTLRRELAARERLAAVGLVAASVAHEVNTPLAGISSYAQMLLEETDAADPRHDMLQRIEAQTFRASRLVRDVLDMARGGPVAREPVDLRDVALSALAAVDAALSAAGVVVETDLPTEAVRIAGDAGRIERAVVNLLLNAKDAAPRGRVRVAVGEDADGAWLTVADDGHGLAPADRARAFEPLYSTKGHQGTGLGLGLAAEVIRAHGGRISLDAAEPRGTVVTIRLPRDGRGDDR